MCRDGEQTWEMMHSAGEERDPINLKNIYISMMHLSLQAVIKMYQ
jgi:hypothetical protein